MEKVILEFSKPELFRLYELVSQKCAALEVLTTLEHITPAQYKHIHFDLLIWLNVRSILKYSLDLKED